MTSDHDEFRGGSGDRNDLFLPLTGVDLVTNIRTAVLLVHLVHLVEEEVLSYSS